MKCVNCGCELPDGSKFCFSCGAKQPEEIVIQPEEVIEEPVVEETPEEPEAAEEIPEFEETEAEGESGMGFKFCPYCGAKNDGDAIFCCGCGRNMSSGTEVVVTTGTEEPFKPKKKFPVKLVVGVVAAVVVVGVAVKLISGLFGGDSNQNLVAYLKDGRVNQIDIDRYKKGPMEYSGRYGIDDFSDESRAKLVYSKDGKYIFYPTDFDYGAKGPEFRLNMQKVGKSEDPIKIDNSVRRYNVLENNKVVYIKNGSNILYKNDKKGNKEKIASDVIDYYIDKKEENIVWVEDDNHKYSVYQQDLALKKGKKALLKDMDSYNVSSDMKQIVGMEEDILYAVKDFKEKEKVDSGVVTFVANNAKSGCVYYTKEAENKTTAADLVEDDCAAADKAMQEPKREDYKIEKIEKNSWTGKYEKYETVDYDKYNAAYDEYSAKERRDSMRERLGEYEITSKMRELYCYKDGKKELVDAGYANEQSYTDSEVFVFNRYNTEDIPKVKLSEIGYVDEVEGKYYEALDKAQQTCVHTGGKIVTLEEKLSGPFAIDDENKTGYGVLVEKTEKEDETEIAKTLVSFAIDSKASGKCKTIAEDLGTIEEIHDGKIYYLTELDDDGSGELYCNDKDVDSDVQNGTLYVDKDSGKVYYTVDYDASKYRGTLKVYNGKDDETVADDVFGYKVLGEKNVAVLVDYNLERYRGDLKLYKGKEDLIELDEDVNFIFGGKTVRY